MVQPLTAASRLVAPGVVVAVCILLYINPCVCVCVCELQEAWSIVLQFSAVAPRIYRSGLSTFNLLPKEGALQAPS